MWVLLKQGPPLGVQKRFEGFHHRYIDYLCRQFNLKRHSTNAEWVLATAGIASGWFMTGWLGENNRLRGEYQKTRDGI